MSVVTPIPAWTDYPVLSLGDISSRPAPLRRVGLMSYDGDKYVHAVVYGEGDEVVAHLYVKFGYIYACRERSGDVPHIGGNIIEALPKMVWDDLPEGVDGWGR